MRIFPLLFFLILLATLTATGGETTFYRLDNGMEVILKENHAAPLISSVVVVKAGSKYESDENNGFTHLLEHMLFNGTETKSREEINEGIKDYGGYINAFTREEMTGYLVVMPKEFISEGFDIQSDQLFNSVLAEDQFPKERDIVVEEIKQDNDVDSYVADKYFNETAFKGTPYARPVIGYESTIRQVSRDEVYDYYKKHYVPNNMIMFVSGDFKTSKMKKLINQYYGAIPTGTLPEPGEFSVNPNFSEDINIKKFPSRNNYVEILIPGPLYNESSYFAFDVLAQYLNSDASPLSKSLTDGEEPLANSVSASIEIQKEFTMLNIFITFGDAKNVNKIVETALTVLRSMPEKEFTPDDVRRVVVPNKVYEIKLEEKLHYYGIMKAPYIATCGYEFLAGYTDNLSNVTEAEVSRVAQKYLNNPKYVASALVAESGASK